MVRRRTDKMTYLRAVEPVLPTTAFVAWPHGMPPSLITLGELGFVLVDSPSNDTIVHYAAQLTACGGKVWVRCCEEPSFDEASAAAHGLEVHECVFPDGMPPSPALIERWLALCARRDGPVAVQCVAGLGRAPVLAAIAFMEAGLPATEAISLIRRHRRGALNRKQTAWLLDEYTPTGALRKVCGGATGCGPGASVGCCVM